MIIFNHLDSPVSKTGKYQRRGQNVPFSQENNSCAYPGKDNR